MKNKGHVLNNLLIKLEELIHSPAQAQHKHGGQDVEYHSVSKNAAVRSGSVSVPNN